MTTKASLIDLNGNEMILDADGDTSITADTDDQIDFKTAGTDRVQINSTGDFLVRQTSADVYDTNSGSSVRQFWGNQFSAQNNTNSRVIIGSASNKGLIGGATVNASSKPIVNSYMAFESVDQTAGGEDGVIAFYTSSGGGSGTEKMRVNESGYVTKPSQPYMRCAGNSASMVTNQGTLTDPFNNWSVQANSGITHSSGVFTVPVAGKYLITYSFYNWINNSGKGVTHYANLKKGSSVYQETPAEYDFADNSYSYYDNVLSNSLVLDMAAGDTFQFAVYADVYGGGSHTNMSAYLLG